MNSPENVDTLIVGGGQAGAQVAASLRSAGYRGSISILEASQHLPYERPPLSKGYLRGLVAEPDLLLRPRQFWADNHVAVVLGTRVTGVDAEDSSVRTDVGRTWSYRNLVWATGGRARRLTSADALVNAHIIRTLDDAQRLRARVADESCRAALIVGGGFIGLEAAATLRARGLSVTVVEAQERLLARVTAQPVAEYFATVHRRRGVDILTGTTLRGIESSRGKAHAVELSDGRQIAADLIVVGIGLEPEIAELRDAGAACSDGVDVDMMCRTSVSNIFAAGDCARQPNTFADGRSIRLESVPNAVNQAKVVAAAIVGGECAESVPWFWSHQYEEKLQTAGLFHGFDEHVVRGTPERGSFSVAYLRDGIVVAIDCVNAPKDFVQGKALIAARARVDAAMLADPNAPLKSHLKLSGSAPRVG